MDKPNTEQILLPVPSAKTQARDKKVRLEFWPKFKKFAAQLPLAEDFAAAYFAPPINPPR